jgi:DnaJ-class molecular chaperone
VLPDPRDHNYGMLTRYKRKEDDLVYHHRITLQQAINCEPAKIPTLDGRILSISLDEIVTPKTVKKILGEGMPIYYKAKDVKHHLHPV